VKRGADLVFRNFEDGVLRLVEDVVDIHARVVALVEDLRRRADQPPQDALFLDDLDVIGNVGRRRDIVHQRREVGRSPDLIDPLLVLEDVAERNQVARFAAFGKVDDRLEDLPVRVAVKVGRGERLQHRVQRRVVQQDAPQDRLLGFQVLGRQLVQGGIDVFHGIGPRETACGMIRLRPSRPP